MDLSHEWQDWSYGFGDAYRHVLAAAESLEVVSVSLLTRASIPYRRGRVLSSASHQWYQSAAPSSPRCPHYLHNASDTLPPVSLATSCASLQTTQCTDTSKTSPLRYFPRMKIDGYQKINSRQTSQATRAVVNAVLTKKQRCRGILRPKPSSPALSQIARMPGLISYM